jgi:hypothetical protein
MALPALSAKMTQMAVLVTYPPPPARYARESQAAVLLVKEGSTDVVARVPQMAVLIAYVTGVPNQSRTRAWTFTLDGHIFYVLNLGPEGTWVYDKTTQQWSKWETDGYGVWNMQNGCMWGTNRIVAGDTLTDQVWEMNPKAIFDDGWRDIDHVVTGGLVSRTRIYHGVEDFRLSCSVGQIDEVAGATMSLAYSDDQGKTWSDEFPLNLLLDDFSDEIVWRSLGSFNAPGRIFRVSDVGGLIRIDGADAGIDSFDQDSVQREGGQ